MSPEPRYLADVDDSSNKTVFKIRLNEYDKDFFQRRILEENAAQAHQPEPTHASHGLIIAARDFFVGKFGQKFLELGNPKVAHEWALQIQSTLVHHVSLVAISSTDEDSAAEVFETLNDRGIGLSTPDLLRNFVMRRSVPSQREEIVALWSEVFEFESDSEIKAFLRHFWTSNYGDVKTQRLYREIRDHIEASNTDSLLFSRELNEASKTYKRIVEAVDDDDDDDFEAILKDIKELGATVLYPVALATIQVNQPADRVKLMQLAVNAYVRHTVIGQMEGSKIESLLFRISAKLRKNSSIEEPMAELSKFSPSDEDFKKSIARAIVNRAATQRYLLRKIELYMRGTSELILNTSKRVHVEHIYSQKPLDGQKWDNHNSLINRLGNLSLFDGPMNSAMKNAQFKDKLPFYEKSEIVITKALTALSDWNADSIANRQIEFSKLAADIWST